MIIEEMLYLVNTMYYNERMVLKSLITELEVRLERMGWSRNQLADHAGVDRATLSRVLSGKQKITYEFVGKLANALQTDVAHLAQLAGLPIVTPPIKRDPSVEYLAQRLDNLPEAIRGEALDALGAQLDAIYKIAGASTGTGKISSDVNTVLKHKQEEDEGITLEEWREFKRIDPEGAQSFLEKQLGVNWREIVKDVEEIRVSSDNEGDGDQVPATAGKRVR